MKKQVCAILLIITFSCSKSAPELLGVWQVKSNYYKATYSIINENDSIKAKVLYYNDGTTILRKEDKNTFYVFENLKPSNNGYVDAVSGATKTNEIKPNIELQSLHKDTLEVITYLRNKPLKEVWIRINK
ncbi:hypothetical protein [Olleya sp. UBA1516]|uniref:hypothetical protein n=1 Tax=Olleya sp. UBA1516 TaxID=1947013 RepID=UPI0025E63046|nr:hypothetical protein [Olleya sp. UBA1516]|tara:strand:- start:569 stop:958 length:390 start_codon:yes stop_codon:yes gene_type:complete